MRSGYRRQHSAPGRTADPVVQVGPQLAVAGQPARDTAGSRSLRPLIGDAIDLRLLVVAADGTEPELGAVTATLDRVGARYDVVVAATDGLAERRLANGDHARYQGVILTRGNLGYWHAGRNRAESALDATGWAALDRFETRFGLRRAVWYALPGGAEPAYGLRLAGSLDTVGAPLGATLTDAGRAVFADLDPTEPVPLARTWVYLAEPAGAHVTPLLVSLAAQTLGAVVRYPDGREHLALTMGHHVDLAHSRLLGYGIVNWVTHGLFLGARPAGDAAPVDAWRAACLTATLVRGAGLVLTADRDVVVPVTGVEGPVALRAGVEHRLPMAALAGYAGARTGRAAREATRC